MVIEKGQPMLASDILDLTFFPAGSILMMDGAWLDGRGGWYICDGRNTPYGKTPNLTDKFIRGGATSGNTGDGLVKLTTDNLPSHNHSFSELKLDNVDNHFHGVGSLAVSNGGSHTHTVSGDTSTTGTHTHTINEGHGAGSGSGDLASGDDYTNAIWKTQTTSSAGGHYHSLSNASAATTGSNHDHGITGSTAGGGGHSHTVSGGTIGNTGEGQEFSVVPAYYSVIYIKKMV
jgi:hypothetical protein